MSQPIQIHFTKASGAGNDFVLIDNRDGRLSGKGERLARCVCDRHFGVGADGLLLLESSQKAHFAMAYYNADGSFGGMCGNGGRCIARYAYLHEIAPKEMNFGALDHIYSAEVSGNVVSLTMRNPSGYSVIPLDVGGIVRNIHFINTGSPHACVFVDDLESVDVVGTGGAIRRHKAFQPDGTNVNFVQAGSDNSLAVRTYERGVEAETLACGTGAVAVAAVGMLTGKVVSPVSILTRSEETLAVRFDRSSERLQNAVLVGSAELLFEGDLLYHEETGRITISGPSRP